LQKYSQTDSSFILTLKARSFGPEFFNFLIFSISPNDKAKPVVKQGRKATDLIKDSRVAKQGGHPGFFFQAVVDLQADKVHLDNCLTQCNSKAIAELD
jgi:hypothetical protein